MKKKIGVASALILGLILMGCNGIESSGANSGQDQAVNSSANDTNTPGGELNSFDLPELSLFDVEGNISGEVVEINENQIIINPQMHSEEIDFGEGDEVLTFAAPDIEDESNWITIIVDSETVFLREEIVRGISQGNEPTIVDDIFIEDTVRVVGEFNGDTFIATAITVLVITN